MVQARVFYVLPVPRFFSQCSGIGGHVAHVWGVVHTLVSAGFHVDVIAEENNAVIEGKGITAHLLPLAAHCLLGRLLWNQRLVRAIKQMSKERMVGFCYARYSAGFSFWVPQLKLALGHVPLVLEANSFATPKYRWMASFERRALRVADLIICNSQITENLALGILDMGLPFKTVVIPNGVDVGRFKKKNIGGFHSPQHAFKIGYTGVLKPDIYGLDTLLKGFSYVRAKRDDVSLHIYGDGPYKEGLMQQAADIRDVHFHGAMPFDRMPEVIQSLDILVCSNQFNHSSPLKIYEYMASGRPVIAARCQQVEGLLGNNERGLLYRKDNARELSEMITLLLDEPELGWVLSTAARKEVEKNHTWENRIEKMLGEMRARRLLNGSTG